MAVIGALLMCGPTAGEAHAAAAAPAGDVISLGDPDALGQVDLYVDPMCPFSGKMVRAQGEAIGQRIDAVLGLHELQRWFQQPGQACKPMRDTMFQYNCVSVGAQTSAKYLPRNESS